MLGDQQTTEAIMNILVVKDRLAKSLTVLGVLYCGLDTLLHGTKKQSSSGQTLLLKLSALVANHGEDPIALFPHNVPDTPCTLPGVLAATAHELDGCHGFCHLGRETLTEVYLFQESFVEDHHHHQKMTQNQCLLPLILATLWEVVEDGGNQDGQVVQPYSDEDQAGAGLQEHGGDRRLLDPDELEEELVYEEDEEPDEEQRGDREFFLLKACFGDRLGDLLGDRGETLGFDLRGERLGERRGDLLGERGDLLLDLQEIYSYIMLTSIHYLHIGVRNDAQQI
ncbi:hypothetical protein E2C01_003785 [Portunus trituberculatus]|uniref:Uncharacterized protein n=1 Tax=Portunus trituberculatus TaxID=210409 RepID=A0A5B7CN88_PORTR|nr:hypothetical protein [Portunus trituberculatus]